MTSIDHALSDWIALLGRDRVILNDPANPREGLRTFGSRVLVPATIYPASTDEVSAAVAIAARHGVRLHPVSRGCNWGLGSRAPRHDGDVIIDLSRLNRISRFNAHEGIVHVEPGVSFIQLYEFLEAHQTDYFLPTIGGPVQASVLANALDRGDAVICDRWRSISDLTVVLPDGKVMQTGYDIESPLAGRGIPPAGPIVDGLFSQSDMGIVTGAWLRLSPLPANISAWLVNVGHRENLAPFVSAWRALQREGTLPDRSFILWNGIKYLARGGQRASYSESVIEEAQLDDWYCAGFVMGETPEIVAARNRRVEQQLSGTAAYLQKFDARHEAVWQEDAKEIFATPRQTNLRTVYWRQSALPDLDMADPDRDNCGLIWICLALPLDGDVIRSLSTWCKERLGRAGMDLNIGLEAASFRTALAYLTLSYQRSAEADAAALKCYRDILNHAAEMGVTPYRSANGLASANPIQDAPRDQFLAKISKQIQ